MYPESARIASLPMRYCSSSFFGRFSLLSLRGSFVVQVLLSGFPFLVPDPDTDLPVALFLHSASLPSNPGNRIAFGEVSCDTFFFVGE